MEQPGTGPWPEMRLRLPGGSGPATDFRAERGARGRVRNPHSGAPGPRPPPLRGAAFDGWTRRRHEGRKPLRLGSPKGMAMSHPAGPGLKPRAPLGRTVPRFEDAATERREAQRLVTRRPALDRRGNRLWARRGAPPPRICEGNTSPAEAGRTTGEPLARTNNRGDAARLLLEI